MLRARGMRFVAEYRDEACCELLSTETDASSPSSPFATPAISRNDRECLLRLWSPIYKPYIYMCVCVCVCVCVCDCVCVCVCMCVTDLSFPSQ